MFLTAGRAPPSSIVLPGLVFGAIAALLLGWYVPAFTAEYGQPIIDVDLHSRAQTLSWMAEYTPAARRAYLVFLLLDCIFPIAGCVFTMAVARVALTSFALERSALRFALIFPIMAAFADLLENVWHAALTLLYPAHAESLASIAWAFTSAKLCFFVGAQLVLCVSIIALAIKQLSRFRSSGS